jgi:hypothetical protein
MLLDELRAACTEFGLRPKPSTKQVGRAGVGALGGSACCKQRPREVWQHVLASAWLILQATMLVAAATTDALACSCESAGFDLRLASCRAACYAGSACR